MCQWSQILGRKWCWHTIFSCFCYPWLSFILGPSLLSGDDNEQFFYRPGFPRLQLAPHGPRWTQVKKWRSKITLFSSNHQVQHINQTRDPSSTHLPVHIPSLVTDPDSTFNCFKQDTVNQKTWNNVQNQLFFANFNSFISYIPVCDTYTNTKLCQCWK